jgi:hypothetical protein
MPGRELTFGGSGRKLPRMTVYTTTRTAVLVCATALAVAGCATTDSEPVNSQSIAAPAQNLLTSADISEVPAGTPGRAFLQYWSNLQYRAWSAALSAYEPTLARSIGVGQLVEALKTQAASFATSKPVLRGTTRVGDQYVVRYSIPDATGRLFASSISWRRSAGSWKIHYDTQLDGMLQLAAQTRVQNEIDPNASRPSKAAVQAGVQASRLQSQYLQSTYRGTSNP